MDIQTNTKKVLIIEDEKAIGKAMEIKLTKNGINAKTVYSGDEGLAELKTNTYDLVLLDLMMPVTDGWTVLSQIKSSGITAKVVITSNLSQEEDIKKAKEMGAVDFLVKSNETLSQIVDEVRRLLNT